MTLNELQRNLLLCYTGTTPTSDGVIETQIRNYQEQAANAIHVMDELKRLAVEMKVQLLTDNLTEFDALLHEEWINKRKMASRVSIPRIDEMYEAARRAGHWEARSRAPAVGVICSFTALMRPNTEWLKHWNSWELRQSTLFSILRECKPGLCGEKVYLSKDPYPMSVYLIDSDPVRWR